VIIILCYGSFFALYGNLIPLNPTCVMLLGGGLAIQIFGRTIDKSQIETDRKKNAGTGMATRHQDICPSDNLLTDILSDENGISIHRLQSLAFNVIYGIGFISYFISSMNDGKYPLITFEGWQLTLLGISAAGYLGVKTNENADASQPARAAEAAAQPQQTSTADADTAVSNAEASDAARTRDENNYQ
jgi:hypothetical protein